MKVVVSRKDLKVRKPRTIEITTDYTCGRFVVHEEHTTHKTESPPIIPCVIEYVRGRFSVCEFTN